MDEPFRGFGNCILHTDDYIRAISKADSEFSLSNKAVYVSRNYTATYPRWVVWKFAGYEVEGTEQSIFDLREVDPVAEYYISNVRKAN